MHNLPKDFNLDYLFGIKVKSFVVRKYDFNLEIGDCTITGQGKVELNLNGIRTVIFDKDPKQTYDKSLVLKQMVKDWKKEGKRTFSIALENGVILKFISESEQYEDFQILHGSKLEII